MRSMMTTWTAPGEGAALATCVIAAVTVLAEEGQRLPTMGSKGASLRKLVADAMLLPPLAFRAFTELRIEDPMGIPDNIDAGRVHEVLRRHLRGPL